jgi:hypothetical protein
MATCRGPGAGVTSGACRVRFVTARARMRDREDGGLAYPQTTRVRMPRISCGQSFMELGRFQNPGSLACSLAMAPCPSHSVHHSAARI